MDDFGVSGDQKVKIMEDDIEEQMKSMAKRDFGVELNHQLFDG